MADNKPTLHHLDHSQSQRILWLLEELGVEYNVVYHFRKPADDPIAPFRSPESLKALGPYGKAPVFTTGAADGNRYIPEGDAICTYLLRKFDTEDKFGLNSGDWVRDETLNCFNLTTFNGVVNWFDGPELREILTILDGELKNAPEGGYFMGKNPGRADIMMEFPMSFVKHRNWVDLEKEFPRLDEWLKRVYDRPAWKRGLQKGNGSYDLNVFPKRAVTS
ncbi:hypothetical protein BOTCAL_0017g00040 [Botryotinia calthae]|uniref:GST N-terminal domain-containing protein n=1 Tax=Botryotinia calthae TaxID=38488 RepID=A0A4Y8DF36_9HELO|nr:hypothetical protein BOTCAL_0017g00040 [Botryotinia calthae]